MKKIIDDGMLVCALSGCQDILDDCIGELWLRNNRK